VSLLTNAFLPDNRRSTAGAYAGFALALLEAVLMLISQKDYAYTAGMNLILNIVWGGTQ
jgi:hypothetical protein